MVSDNYVNDIDENDEEEKHDSSSDDNDANDLMAIEVEDAKTATNHIGEAARVRNILPVININIIKWSLSLIIKIIRMIMDVGYLVK